MRTLEKEGKSVDEAIWNGLQELGLTRDQVRVEILEQGSRGLFGIGARPAKVLLIAIEKEEEHIDIDIRGFLRGDADIADPAPEVRQTLAEEPVSTQPQQAARPQRERTSRERRPAVEAPRSTYEPVEPYESQFEEQPPQTEASRRIAEQLQHQSVTLPPRSVEHLKQPQRDRQRPRRDTRRESSSRQDSQITRSASVPAPADLVVPTEGIEATLHTFLTNLLSAMHLQCSIGVECQDTTLTASIYGDGNDLGLLIGKHGATLDSLQYLSSLAVNRQGDKHYRVQVQIGDYRKRREDTLTRLAERIADKVIREQRSHALEPMLASERRLIHLALQEHALVETSSEGEEPRRYVVVSLRSTSEE